jgi:hypothetical protein
VRVDGLALRLRPRNSMEAADLGVRLCQGAARSVFPCYLVVAVPVMAIALASVETARWLPIVWIWFAKPWLDRTILFVLSRAAFGQSTSPADLWRSQKSVWWNQLLFTWTIRRLSLWRSLTQPVYQLEGLSLWRAGTRVRQIRRRTAGAALTITSVFALLELAILASLASLVFWFAPSGQAPDVAALMSGEISSSLGLMVAGAYAIAVLFLEPFYVAAGFGLYLNRRAELEAWDIEQEIRRAFAH